MDEAKQIPVTICNPGSDSEFYTTTVTTINQYGGFTIEVRYFRLDESGKAIPHTDPHFGSAYITTYISDPF